MLFDMSFSMSFTNNSKLSLLITKPSCIWLVKSFILLGPIIDRILPSADKITATSSKDINGFK